MTGDTDIGIKNNPKYSFAMRNLAHLYRVVPIAKAIALRNCSALFSTVKFSIDSKAPCFKLLNRSSSITKEDSTAANFSVSRGFNT